MDDAKKEVLEQMDADALEARKDLELHLDEWQAKDVAVWWKRWYMKAGHKPWGVFSWTWHGNSRNKRDNKADGLPQETD